MDILSVNRYYGWYISMPYLDTIKLQLTTDLTSWHKKFDRAVILTEYGAGAVEGVNFVSEFVTQNYQSINAQNSVSIYRLQRRIPSRRLRKDT